MSLSLYVTNATAFFPYVQTLYMIENKTFLIFAGKKNIYMYIKMTEKTYIHKNQRYLKYDFLQYKDKIYYFTNINIFS